MFGPPRESLHGGRGDQRGGCGSGRSLGRPAISLTARGWLFAVAACLASASGCSRRSSIVISEFVASNTSGLRDVDGETSDWIELQNTGTTTASLEGWCLTDDPRQVDKWCFPSSASIPAGGFVLVFASGKSFTGPDAQLHATFKLKASEDYLGLVRPGGAIVQEFDPYPDQKENVAYGVTPRGTPGFLETPTPGAPNR